MDQSEKDVLVLGAVVALCLSLINSYLMRFHSYTAFRHSLINASLSLSAQPLPLPIRNQLLQHLHMPLMRLNPLPLNRLALLNSPIPPPPPLPKHNREILQHLPIPHPLRRRQPTKSSHRSARSNPRVNSYLSNLAHPLRQNLRAALDADMPVEHHVACLALRKSDYGAFGDYAICADCDAAAFGANACIRVQDCVWADCDGEGAGDLRFVGHDGRGIDITWWSGGGERRGCCGCCGGAFRYGWSGGHCFVLCGWKLKSWDAEVVGGSALWHAENM